jgi:hypothetical protein
MRGAMPLKTTMGVTHKIIFFYMGPVRMWKSMQAADVRRSERKQASASKLTSKMESLNAMKASRDRQAEAKAQAEASPAARAEVGSPSQRPDVQEAPPPPPPAKTPVRTARPEEERRKESAGLRSELESSEDEEPQERRGRPDRVAASPDVGYDLETESFEASAEEVLSMQVRPLILSPAECHISIILSIRASVGQQAPPKASWLGQRFRQAHPALFLESIDQQPANVPCASGGLYMGV